MLALTTTSFLNQSGSLSKYFQTATQNPLALKVQELIVPIFKGGASLYLCAFGAAEIIQSGAKITHSLASSQAYMILHGGLMAASGISSLADALYAFGVMNPGNLANANYIAGSILFLCANIIGLEENVRIFNDAGTNSPIDETRDQEKQSAFWGILNNIGYIITTAMLLYGKATAPALVFAALSCFAGGIKILYDLALYYEINIIPNL